MRTSLWIAIAATALLAACFSLDVSDGKIQCLSGSQKCPNGYFCGGNDLCYRNGHTAPTTGSDGGTNDGGAVCGTPSDPKNCGTCGHDCTMLPNVASATGVTCNSGACQIAASACTPGYGHCSSNPDDGCETDLSQPAHCGSCSACPSATPLCAANTSGGNSYMCTVSCQTPTADQCGNTCTSLQSDPEHCGTCATLCSYAHAAAMCTGGACAQGTCVSGYMHCSSDPNSGCETYVMGNDVNNCGGCNTKCKVGQVCNAGVCGENQVTCSSPGITCQQAGCYHAGQYSISTGGGIVVDLVNGPRNLWTRTTRTITGHSAAVSDCATLVLEGVNGWRMPTFAELVELNYMTGGLQGCPTCDPAIDQAAFPDTAASLTATPIDGYWSNTYDGTIGWDVDDECDGRNNYQDSGTGLGAYRCIHDPGP
ncbi:MAG TPA: hypothetical protein VIA18_29620 [Polyangia bacterium]|jgi:hypothetical protein|nr:hypothetical protein [Polyangia bacterium]